MGVERRLQRPPGLGAGCAGGGRGRHAVYRVMSTRPAAEDFNNLNYTREVLGFMKIMDAIRPQVHTV